MQINLEPLIEYKRANNTYNKAISEKLGFNNFYVGSILSGKIKSMSIENAKKFINLVGGDFFDLEAYNDLSVKPKLIKVEQSEEMAKTFRNRAKRKHAEERMVSCNCLSVKNVLEIAKIPFTLSKSGLVFVIRGKRNIDFKYQSSVIIDRVSKKSCLGNVKKVIEMYNKKEG